MLALENKVINDFCHRRKGLRVVHNLLGQVIEVDEDHEEVEVGPARSPWRPDQSRNSC